MKIVLTLGWKNEEDTTWVLGYSEATTLINRLLIRILTLGY